MKTDTYEVIQPAHVEGHTRPNPSSAPIIVDVATACTLLSVGRTKLFQLLQPGGSLQRVKIGRKTLVTRESIEALAASGCK